MAFSGSPVDDPNDYLAPTRISVVKDNQGGLFLTSSTSSSDNKTSPADPSSPTLATGAAGAPSSTLDPPVQDDEHDLESSHAVASPVPISPHPQRSNNISFSPLPSHQGRSSSLEGRRFHEFSPSPARSLAHVLGSAEAAAQAKARIRRDVSTDSTSTGADQVDQQWMGNTSGVHFQPQTSRGAVSWMGTSVPESRFSEFEVVYDDGVRKQRTFSLTTEMDDEDNISSSDNEETSSLLHNHHQEAHLGQGGYTGLQGASATWHPPSHAQNHGPFKNNVQSLPHGHPSFPPPSGAPFTWLISSLQGVWYAVFPRRLNLAQKRIFKASLAYLFACAISFIPFFRPYIGATGHLAATSAVFFNPAKSLGRMVDAAAAGLCAITFGVLVSIASMASAIWFNHYDLYIWGHVVSVVVFGGGSTFVVAYAKAYFNRPTVNVACTLSHMIILVTLTKEGALLLGEFSLVMIKSITISMVLGVLISVLICIFLWPESAHEKLRQDMGKSLTSFRLLLKLLTKTFLLEADTTPFGSESVQKLIESQVKSFSALATSLEEAQLEFPAIDIKKYEECVKSLNTLAQYLNGLRSSCGLQYDMLQKDEKRKEDEQRSTEPGTEAAPRRGLGLGVRMSSYSLIGSLHSDQEQSASADLIEFLDHVGKPMKSLALTCKLTIEHLQDIFMSSDSEYLVARAESHLANRYSRHQSRHSYQGPPQQNQQRQSDYDPAEVFSDSTFDFGHPTGSSTRIHHPDAADRESFKKYPSLVLMQINLAKALDIFESANSKALKKFYSYQNRRRSGIFKQPLGGLMMKRMSEPSLQDLGSASASDAFLKGLGAQATSRADHDAVAEKAPVGEQIFLIYFFVFNLMEFSKELANLVSCVEVLVDGDEGLALWIARNQQSWWRRIWFSLTGFPRRLRSPVRNQAELFDSFDDPEPGLGHPAATSQTSNTKTADQNNNSGSGSRGPFRRNRKPRLFPKPNIHNTTNTLHTPMPSTKMQRLSTQLWKFLHIFRSFQVKYAAKAAISTMVLLIPAFVDWTRPYFVEYRGEWALISMLIVMVPTVGGTNIVGIYRILGTVAGCYAGVAVYLAFPAHDVMLPLCCFLFAVPNFYLVLCSSYPRIGQVTLLAFNLVLIQTYNRRHGDGSVPPDDDDDAENTGGTGPSPSAIIREAVTWMGVPDSKHKPMSDVWTIAFHRAVAVSLGVVVGVAVTSYVWPYEARVELRKGLSDLLLNISWLYNRLVSVYSTNLDRVSVIPVQDHYQQSRSRFRALLRKTTFQQQFQTPVSQNAETATEGGEEGDIDINKMNKEFMAIELSLQLQLLRLYALLEETPNEPRLKGKFPVRTYKNMLGSCQNILDRFLSMRLVITKDQWLESARRDFIVPVNKERREMVGNVLLYFYTIASALRLKTPLPPYLPPANNARLRLIQKIRQLPVVQNKVVLTEDNDERYIFYYAYALVMDDVIRELERLGHWSQDLFGVITPESEFEAWFTDDGIPPPMIAPPEVPSSATREAPQAAFHRDVEQPHRYSSESRPPQSYPSQRMASGPRPTSTPGKYRYHPDGHPSQVQNQDSYSNYQPEEGSVNERDGLFYFDPQDPFRDPQEGLGGSLGSAGGNRYGIRNSRRQTSLTSLQSVQAQGRGYGSIGAGVSSGGGGGGGIVGFIGLGSRKPHRSAPAVVPSFAAPASDFRPPAPPRLPSNHSSINSRTGSGSTLRSVRPSGSRERIEGVSRSGSRPSVNSAAGGVQMADGEDAGVGAGDVEDRV